jgi:HlyD family secretion protein
MKRSFSIILLISGLVILAACSVPAPAAVDTAAETQQEATLEPVRAPDNVVADAIVAPVQEASLSMPVSGIVAEVLVVEGEQVEAGAPLLRVVDARQRAAVAQAEAAWQRAQAQLDELLAGPRPEEIAVAEMTVEAAKKELEKLESGARQEEIAAAQAGLAAAQASLQKVLEGPDVNERIAAQAEVDDAAAQVRQAQAAYDRVKGDPHIGSRPEALQLEQATNAYRAAQARLDALDNQVTAADIAEARARVDQAQADLDLVRAPARSIDLAAAEVEIRRAEAELALVSAGARPETIAAAEADVASAEASLQEALAALEETLLNAPMAGMVAQLDADLGEQVASGQVVVRLADTRQWQIETDDLTELDVVDVQVGAPAKITFDAMPDLELTGTVERIKAIGENKLGDMTYTVIIRPDRLDDRMRWNMTATVTIE